MSLVFKSFTTFDSIRPKNHTKVINIRVPNLSRMFYTLQVRDDVDIDIDAAIEDVIERISTEPTSEMGLELMYMEIVQDNYRDSAFNCTAVAQTLYELGLGLREQFKINGLYTAGSLPFRVIQRVGDNLLFVSTSDFKLFV